MDDKIKAAAESLIKNINPRDAHVGIGDGELIVYVTRSKSVSNLMAKRLKEIDGFPVRVQYVGKVKPA